MTGMPDCRDIEPALASYVEGECPLPECSRVDAHLDACPVCRTRVAGERAARELLQARRDQLRGCAPARLRERCASACAKGPHPAVLSASAFRWMRWPLAATLLLVAGLVGALFLGNTVESYAAQLAVDHVKCFTLPPDAARESAESLARSWEARQGWPIRIAPAASGERLDLLGVRRCGSTRGRVAHVLYRWRGQPLSVYVLNGHLPGAADVSEVDHHPHAAVKRLGEQEIIWSDRGRTYAVVARASVSDLQHLAGYLRQQME